MICGGILVAALSVLSMVEGASLLSWVIFLGIGILLCVAGCILLITEVLETWLSGGQKALVDGLQAG